MSSKIAVIYSSTYGHVRTLAEAQAKAAREAGATVDIFQFPEILSDEVLAKMHAAPKADYPIIKPQDLTEYDGFLFGIPTRYGRAVGAASAFFDQTGGLWASGALVGKFAGIFTSSASQHGGQETTALTTLPFLAHHGIIYVPTGFGAKELSDNSEIVGGSAWGAAAIASGDGSRAVSEKELAVAHFQASSFVKIVSTFVKGKTALAGQAPAPTVSTTAEPALEPTAPATSASAKAVPTTAGYDVPSSTTTTPAGATAAEPQQKQPPQQATTTSTPATPAPAPAPAPAVVEKKSQTKSKGGLFSCCGKSQHYDS